MFGHKWTFNYFCKVEQKTYQIGFFKKFHVFFGETKVFPPTKDDLQFDPNNSR